MPRSKCRLKPEQSVCVISNSGNCTAIHPDSSVISRVRAPIGDSMSLAAEAHIHPGRTEGDSPCRLDTALLQLFLNKIQKQAGTGF